MKRIFLPATLLVFLFCNSSFAQLTVQGGFTAQQLVNKLLGSGVSVSNVVYTGATNAAGTFKGTSSNIGLDSGVLITSGRIANAPGPNNETDVTWDNGLSGDADLTALSGNMTYDATILEFDFVPQYNNIKFRYVFASDEYPEFVCNNVNDVFAFFLSGPGITGKQNLALIPNSGARVCINSVNGGTLGSVGGDPGSPNCSLVNSAYYVSNNGNTVEYDGFTKVLTAQASVTANSTYHIRLAIADAGDRFYDSGVFLEAASFSGTSVPPVAAFQASKTLLCANDCINFTDQSTGGATSWSWTFPGGKPATSTIQNPNRVCYFTQGTYSAKLVVANSTGQKDSTTLTLNVKAGPLQPVIKQSDSLLYFNSDTSYKSYQWYNDTVLIPGATDTFLVITTGGQYNVKITNGAGCMIAVGANVILSLPYNYADNYISLYPDPAVDKLIIHVKQSVGKNQLAIYNVLGAVLLKTDLYNRESEIDISSFPKGIYFLQMKWESGSVVKRFVKE